MNQNVDKFGELKCYKIDIWDNTYLWKKGEKVDRTGDKINRVGRKISRYSIWMSDEMGGQYKWTLQEKKKMLTK